ncbi:SpoIIE family protein phosphatase [Pasteurella atlantica]|uniref:SpoIIE family protein phosphatase n=1 Tax=Pasteurellaceae TaxID=712 RepID=UPI00275D213A|nr:SpoIIE family protein phosphatase [Pasteurella atlantica]MDP8034196.1 SpoIIE family protein phosphatase [Pasteurella atlantica]MDP8036141.1 SpoIIE family protein phosphatase [Pasteurella atlantica]MDP8038091.1 SpoIIE family protein phosphatase [Pasteurella atlantica]MDP8048446.1 SpoIIE family protein phosphatase [Pasteurella atlantica]MDP8050403.1 SpoIIE family protein phosphatase [Pasteurella atlantica]
MKSCQLILAQYCKDPHPFYFRNNDALFNGGKVLQHKFLATHSLTRTKSRLILGVADALYDELHSYKASHFWMEQLGVCQKNQQALNYQWLCETQQKFNKAFAQENLGIATVFSAVEIDLENQIATLLNVGNCRVYLVNSQGEWTKISQDHVLLPKKNNPRVKYFQNSTESLSSYLIANNQPFQTAYFHQKIDIQADDTLLLFTAGIMNETAIQQCKEIWNKFNCNKKRVNFIKQMLISKKYICDDFSMICCSFL